MRNDVTKSYYYYDTTTANHRREARYYAENAATLIKCGSLNAAKSALVKALNELTEALEEENA